MDILQQYKSRYKQAVKYSINYAFILFVSGGTNYSYDKGSYPSFVDDGDIDEGEYM